ncbi:MAG: hypothetical protein HQL01_04845 [Nitrospirae bacterium]|nr:hypothetical protein [Nitrospirota bacterium]
MIYKILLTLTAVAILLSGLSVSADAMNMPGPTIVPVVESTQEVALSAGDIIYNTPVPYKAAIPGLLAGLPPPAVPPPPIKKKKWIPRPRPHVPPPVPVPPPAVPVPRPAVIPPPPVPRPRVVPPPGAVPPPPAP